jgi:serine/threonine protein kinase
MDQPGEVLEMAMDDGHILRVPKHFGRYEYIKTLGEGGSGIVVLVRHAISLVLFACKVVSREFLNDHNLFDRFEQEVRLLPSLIHLHIVHFEEVLFTPDLIFLIMEFCSQGDLLTHIANEGMFAVGRARIIFHQIAEAVKFIHGKNIAHRDLKPNNVLIDKQFNAKLADFGLCHVSTAGKLLKTPCGSPLYAPPEILSSQDYDGKAADIWSLGILLYTMVTGTLPWSSENQIELFRQIRQADIDVPAHLSPTIQELLAKMLQRDPVSRLTIEEVLESSWFPKTQNTLKPLGRAATDSPHRRGSVTGGGLALSPIIAGGGPKKLIVRPKKTTTMGQTVTASPSFRLPTVGSGVMGLLGNSQTWD